MDNEASENKVTKWLCGDCGTEVEAVSAGPQHIKVCKRKNKPRVELYKARKEVAMKAEAEGVMVLNGRKFGSRVEKKIEKEIREKEKKQRRKKKVLSAEEEEEEWWSEGVETLFEEATYEDYFDWDV